jgi:hypothetical protein
MPVQYIPPDETVPPPPEPPAPDRTMLWIGVAIAAVLVVALAIIIPLALRGGGGGAVTTTSEVTTSTLAPATTTEAPTTTTTLPGAVGDSSGAWVEVSVPGGPWTAQEVAVSGDTLLVVSPVATGYKLSAVRLESGDVITVSQSEALFGIDLDGDVAVWWEASGYDSATETYANQYIKSCLLSSGAKNTLASGGTARLGMPQVALPWVTWVQSQPWADDPEYYAESIFGAKVDASGAAIGAAVTMVPAALAFALGDSSWQYSLSSTRLAWETHAAIGGYDPGTHVMRIDLSGHEWVGAEAWRPSVWGELLVYQDGSLKLDDLSSGDTQVIDPSGDFATAGPTFVAFYTPNDTGSYLIASGYTGKHEQTLGDLGAPPYFCPPISVSSEYIAYAFDDQIHLFRWQAQ